MSDYEYRINSPYRDNSITTDPKKAGENYRYIKKYMIEGETLELQKRKVEPWETIEKESK